MIRNRRSRKSCSGPACSSSEKASGGADGSTFPTQSVCYDTLLEHNIGVQRLFACGDDGIGTA